MPGTFPACGTVITYPYWLRVRTLADEILKRDRKAVGEKQKNENSSLAGIQAALSKGQSMLAEDGDRLAALVRPGARKGQSSDLAAVRGSSS